jgi:hypothetical protein
MGLAHGDVLLDALFLLMMKWHEGTTFLGFWHRLFKNTPAILNMKKYLKNSTP